MITKKLRPIIHPLRVYYYPLIGKRIELPQAEASAQILYPKYIDSSDNVIEVGARTGGGTLVLSELANHVYSFEPVHFSYRMLKMNTRKRHNVTCFNYAVGEEAGTTVLNLPKGQDCPWVASTKKLLGFEYGKQQKAAVVKLDDFNFLFKPTALIIDCEGQEEEVLQGAKNLLPKLRTVLIETHTLSDGSETLPAVRSALSKYSDTFGIDETFLDREKQRWLIANSFFLSGDESMVDLQHYHEIPPMATR